MHNGKRCGRAGRQPRVVLSAALLWLALGAAPLVRAGDAPAYAGIDHVEFFVSDLERSLVFYTRLFGTAVWKHRQVDRHYLLLGDSYMALEQQPNARVDHLCFGIDAFDIGNVHRWLDLQALAWQDYPSGRDLRVDDRDGTRVQLAADGTWDTLSQGSVVTVPRSGPAALFHPLALDEVYITVSNLEVDSLHYARLLGKTGRLQAGSLWFDIGDARLRLSQSPVGQKSGVNYFSVLVSNIDLEAAADAVFKAGGIIENILPNGFSFWDPDGLRVEIHVAPQL